MGGRQVGKTEVTLGKVEKVQQGQPAVLEMGKSVPIGDRGDGGTHKVGLSAKAECLVNRSMETQAAAKSQVSGTLGCRDREQIARSHCHTRSDI